MDDDGDPSLGNDAKTTTQNMAGNYDQQEEVEMLTDEGLRCCVKSRPALLH